MSLDRTAMRKEVGRRIQSKQGLFPVYLAGVKGNGRVTCIVRRVFERNPSRFEWVRGPVESGAELFDQLLKEGIEIFQAETYGTIMPGLRWRYLTTEERIEEEL